MSDSSRKNQASRCSSGGPDITKKHVAMIHADRLRAVEELAEGMAHQLKQPLVGVLGLAEHLLIGVDRGWDLTDSKVKDKLKGIVEQADRMKLIIDGMRKFAEETGRCQKRLVEVNDVVEASRALSRFRFQCRGLRLSAELAERLPPVVANPFSLQEAILNLLTNARQALEEQLKAGTELTSRTVLVRTSQLPRKPEWQVKIEVIDQGVGIPPDILGKVFDPYFTTRGPDRGLGLGLSITQILVEELGGGIDIQSTPACGTTATICLPAQPPSEENR